MEKHDIFVSCDRKSGLYLALTLRNKLIERGYSVSDETDMELSITKLFEVLGSAEDLVAVLSPGCLDNCSDTEDAMRKELGIAIATHKNIITVVMPGFRMPLDLPDDIKSITTYQFIVADPNHLDVAIEKMVGMLKSAPKNPEVPEIMKVYQGKEPFIFVSYSHKDSYRVLPIIHSLQCRGFRVWYDEGIEAGTEWPAYIEERLDSCQRVLVFLSDNSIESVNCRNEINVAAETGREMLVAQLDEEVTYKYGMRLQLSSRQKIFCSRHPDVEALVDELAKAKILENCKGPYDPIDPPVYNPPARTSSTGTGTAKTGSGSGSANKTPSQKPSGGSGIRIDPIPNEKYIPDPRLLKALKNQAWAKVFLWIAFIFVGVGIAVNANDVPNPGFFGVAYMLTLASIWGIKTGFMRFFNSFIYITSCVCFAAALSTVTVDVSGESFAALLPLFILYFVALIITKIMIKSTKKKLKKQKEEFERAQYLRQRQRVQQMQAMANAQNIQ